jgi:hypothetical protein
MSEPRYIVRELYGQTIGEPTSSWQFLVLDTHDCHRVVLERHSGRRDGEAARLRHCVAEYADVLNTPRICACGCGEELPLRFPVRHRGGTARICVNKAHTDKACEDRRRERRRERRRAAYTSKRL